METAEILESDKLHDSTWEAAEVKPAPRVWTEPMPEALADKLAFFRENGFLIIRNCFDATAVEQLVAETNRFAKDWQTLPSIREGFAIEAKEKWPNPNEPVFRKIGGLVDLSEHFREAARHPKIMEILTALHGPVVQLYRDVLMMKQAVIGREKPWHQDGVYWAMQPKELVSAMTALDSSDPSNGCLQVVPGSHRRGELPHFGKELQVTLDAEQQSQAVYVPLQPGDTLIFHCLLLHASEPNTSNAHRRVGIISYNFPHIMGTRPEENERQLLFDANA